MGPSHGHSHDGDVDMDMVAALRRSEERKEAQNPQRGGEAEETEAAQDPQRGEKPRKGGAGGRKSRTDAQGAGLKAKDPSGGQTPAESDPLVRQTVTHQSDPSR